MSSEHLKRAASCPGRSALAGKQDASNDGRLKQRSVHYESHLQLNET